MKLNLKTARELDKTMKMIYALSKNKKLIKAMRGFGYIIDQKELANMELLLMEYRLTCRKFAKLSSNKALTAPL